MIARLLCMLGLHKFPKWSVLGGAGHSSYHVVQARECERCGLIKVRKAEF